MLKCNDNKSSDTLEERLLVKDLYVVSVQRDTIFESLALRQ